MHIPVITILHSIPDRVRLQFSVPPVKVENFRRRLLKDKRIRSVQYSPVRHSCLITYDHKRIELLHIFRMIVVNLADEYGRQPVFVRPEGAIRFSRLTLLSASFILAALLARSIKSASTAGMILGWTAVVSTAAAVIEHALIEVRHTGTFDPEALSVVYLINSASRGRLVRGALFTWLASFSRHLLRLPTFEGMKLTVVEGVDELSQKRYLDVTISGSIPLRALEGKTT